MVDIEDKAEDNEHLLEQFQSAFTHKHSLVLKPSNNCWEKTQIHVSRHKIFLSEFYKNFHNFNPTERRSVQKPFKQELQKFDFGLSKDHGIFRIDISFLTKYFLNNITQHFDQRLP